MLLGGSRALDSLPEEWEWQEWEWQEWEQEEWGWQEWEQEEWGWQEWEWQEWEREALAASLPKGSQVAKQCF